MLLWDKKNASIPHHGTKDIFRGTTRLRAKLALFCRNGAHRRGLAGAHGRTKRFCHRRLTADDRHSLRDTQCVIFPIIAMEYNAFIKAQNSKKVKIKID